MSRLFSYCIPFDDGAAPNPYWGVCTLNICKPIIRRTARKGDWIVGTGSTKFGFENMVVYAMEVTEVLTMNQYDSYCKTQFPQKIPNWKSETFEERMGDCIYDFSTESPRLRKSVHNILNRDTDLGGKNTLLSDHFYYFGDHPEPLPDYLLKIVKQGQGHKSTSIRDCFLPFVDWIMKYRQAKNKVNSNPKSSSLYAFNSECINECAARNKSLDEHEGIELQNTRSSTCTKT